MSSHLLLKIFVKDGGTVLFTCITELTIVPRWIDMPPEMLKDFSIAEPSWIVGYLHSFNVAAIASSNLPISRIYQPAAGISGYHFHHTFELFKICFDAPETATGKYGFFKTGFLTSLQRIR